MASAARPIMNFLAAKNRGVPRTATSEDKVGTGSSPRRSNRTEGRRAIAEPVPVAAPTIDPELDSIVDPIITMDHGGTIQSASSSVEQVFGWTPMELFGRNIKLLIPEPKRSALDRYLDRYRSADTAKSLERTRRFDAVRKDGSLLHIELSMSRADLPNVGAAYFIGIIRDVSRQIDVLPDGTGDRTRLQGLLIEQTRALATANLRLQLADRLASLGTLAAGLGHDMNNVLLPVRAQLTALSHAGINDAALSHVAAVQRSVAYLQLLSEGLHFLAMDPDTASSGHDGDGTTDIAHWWSQAGILLRTALPKRIRLVAAFPAGLPSVNIAPQWLTQAVLNLLINAGESMPPRRFNARVRIGAELSADGSMIRLGITDNGRGMTPAVQRRAPHLFFTTKPRRMGTGLGLPLARKVALRAGGDIEIRSALGKGTTVVLVMPASKVLSSDPAANQDARLRSASISVRDQRTSSLIAQILVKAGFQVRPMTAKTQGTLDIWVTDPTPGALASAAGWRAGNPSRMLVVVGTPAKRYLGKWAAAGATVIDHPDDFESIRHALSTAILNKKRTP